VVKEDPANFEKYVQEYSIDPSSKSLDGSVPPIPRHSSIPNVEEVAFKMKPGHISAVVQLDDSPSRYVIMKCEGRTDPVVTQLDDQVRAELEDQLRKQKTQELVAKVFQEIKDNTRVDNYYTNTATGGTKPGNVSRTDGAKPVATRPATKRSPAEDRAGEIQPTGGKTLSPQRVQPAAATSDADVDLAPPPPPRPTTRRPTTNSLK